MPATRLNAASSCSGLDAADIDPRISFCIGHGFSFDPQSLSTAAGAAGFADVAVVVGGAFGFGAVPEDDATGGGADVFAGAAAADGAGGGSGSFGSRIFVFGSSGSGAVSGSAGSFDVPVGVFEAAAIFLGS